MTRLLAALAPGVSSGEARGPGHRPDCRPVLGLLPGASFLIVRSPVCLWKMQATGQGHEKEPRQPGLGGPSWGRSLSRWWLPAQDHGSPAQDPKGDRPHSLGGRWGKEVPWERQGSPRSQIRGLNAGSVRHPASCVPVHVACVCLGLRPCVGAERQAAPQPLVAARGLSQAGPAQQPGARVLSGRPAPAQGHREPASCRRRPEHRHPWLGGGGWSRPALWPRADSPHLSSRWLSLGSDGPRAGPHGDGLHRPSVCSPARTQCVLGPGLCPRGNGHLPLPPASGSRL